VGTIGDEIRQRELFSLGSGQRCIIEGEGKGNKPSLDSSTQEMKMKDLLKTCKIFTLTVLLALAGLGISGGAFAGSYGYQYGGGYGPRNDSGYNYQYRGGYRQRHGGRYGHYYGRRHGHRYDGGYRHYYGNRYGHRYGFGVGALFGYIIGTRHRDRLRHRQSW